MSEKLEYYYEMVFQSFRIDYINCNLFLIVVTFYVTCGFMRFIGWLMKRLELNPKLAF